jgi:hypothetical protein
MPLAEDIAFIGQLIDAYAVGADRKGVASGVPAAMQVGQTDAYGWVEWRVLPSTLSEAEVAELENKFGIHFPPLFRAYLLARFHLFDQLKSSRHDQLILMTDTPAKKPLAPLLHLMSAWRPLIDAGFIPFAEWGDSWGPMCFDTGRRASDGDCPIVWMDHEILASVSEEQCRARKKVLPLAQPLYESCRELMIDVFGQAANKSTGANAGGPHQPPVRKSWAARIAQFFRWA